MYTCASAEVLTAVVRRDVVAECREVYSDGGAPWRVGRNTGGHVVTGEWIFKGSYGAIKVY